MFLLKLDKQFPVEPFEATVSQSTVPSPPLKEKERERGRGRGRERERRPAERRE